MKFSRLSALWDRLPFAARLLTTATTALVVASAVMLLTVAREEARRTQAEMAATLDAELDTLPAALAETVVIGDFSTLQQTLDRYVTRPLIARVNFHDVSGVTLQSVAAGPPQKGPPWFAELFGYTPLDGSASVVVGGRTYGTITIALSPQLPAWRNWHSLKHHLGILMVAIIVDFLGIWLILRYGLKPLQAIVAALKRFAAGELETRIPPQGSPELRETIETVNRMAESLQALTHGLLVEQERLEVTLRSIGDGVISTDAEGRVEFMNPVAEALTGWRLTETKGRPIQQVFSILNERTRQEVVNPVDRVLREGCIVGLANHTLLIARDGIERPIADSAAPIRHADGRILGAVLVFRDQTEERRMLKTCA